jgi:hypothetical protein
MKDFRNKLPIMLLIAILLGSCAGQAPTSATPDVNAIMTQGVGTFMAQFFQTQTAMVTPATPTPLNTPTFIPTSTAMPLPSPIATATAVIYSTAVIYPAVTPTGTYYTPTVNPSTLGYGCNNLGLINDIALDSSTVQPGTHFSKTWQVANTGTCDWKYTYRLVFVGGDEMDGSSVSLRNEIAPNKWTKITVNLTAPKNEGTYTGYWQLSDNAGHTFGATLAVKVTVKKSSYP